MVPTPTSLWTPTPATEVNNSGADDPAAMNVAPATSSLNWSLSEMASREGTKKSSQIIAIAALYYDNIMINFVIVEDYYNNRNKKIG